MEHCFRLTNQLFLCGPVFLKNSQRIVSLILLIMVGCLVAGLIERQIRRALAERHEPIHGLMPEGRDTLKPTVARILRAFADYSLVLIKWADGHLLQRQFARPNPVQQQILNVLEMPHPEALFGEPLPLDGSEPIGANPCPLQPSRRPESGAGKPQKPYSVLSRQNPRYKVRNTS